jgi:hypothetical protein
MLLLGLAIGSVHSSTDARYIGRPQDQFPYECATGSTTEEQNLNVFETWVPRKIF